MKFIICNKCGSFTRLEREPVCCECGDIGGYYNEDGRSATILLGRRVKIEPDNYSTYCRVIAIPNQVVMGTEPVGSSWVFDFSWFDTYHAQYGGGVRKIHSKNKAYHPNDPYVLWEKFLNHIDYEGYYVGPKLVKKKTTLFKLKRRFSVKNLKYYDKNYLGEEYRRRFILPSWRYKEVKE